MTISHKRDKVLVSCDTQSRCKNVSRTCRLQTWAKRCETGIQLKKQWNWWVFHFFGWRKGDGLDSTWSNMSWGTRGLSFLHDWILEHLFTKERFVKMNKFAQATVFLKDHVEYEVRFECRPQGRKRSQMWLLFFSGAQPMSVLVLWMCWRAKCREPEAKKWRISWLQSNRMCVTKRWIYYIIYTSRVRWCEAMFAYENWHHLVRPELLEYALALFPLYLWATVAVGQALSLHSLVTCATVLAILTRPLNTGKKGHECAELFLTPRLDKLALQTCHLLFTTHAKHLRLNQKPSSSIYRCLHFQSGYKTTWKQVGCETIGAFHQSVETLLHSAAAAIVLKFSSAAAGYSLLDIQHAQRWQSSLG